MHVQQNLNAPNYGVKPNFKAIPRARYQVAKDDFVRVYQLEKQDVPFLKKFAENMQQYFKDRQINDFSHQQVMEEAFGAAQKILESPTEPKAKVLLATIKMEPCGIIIGNASKKSQSGQVVYSSRKNQAKNETELDWLAAWNPQKKPVKGVGKILTAEYFNTLKKDGFRDVYVRSEVPELSYAQAFYEKMGFETLPKKREQIVKHSTNRYFVGNYDSEGDEIVPMVAVRTGWEKAKNTVSDLFNRKQMEGRKVDISSVVV